MHKLSALAGLAILTGLAAGSAAQAQSVTCTSFSPSQPEGQTLYSAGTFTSASWSFIATPSNCNWTITATTGALTYSATQSGGQSGVGSATILATYPINQTSQVMVATVTIGSGSNSYVMTVYQNPVSCHYGANPSSFPAIGSNGGSYAITVIPSPSACFWLLDSPQSWILQPVDANGFDTVQTGTQTVYVIYQANTSGPARSGYLTIEGDSSGGVDVPVTQAAPGSPALQLSSNSVSGSGLIGSSSVSLGSPISITSSGAPINFTVSTQTTGGWQLLTSLGSASTPNSLSITANLQGLAPGTYSGTVTVTPTSANSNGPQIIKVSVIAQGQDTLQVTYAPNFNQTLNLTYPSVTSGTITVNSSNTSIAGLFFTAASSVVSPFGGSWLSVSPGGNSQLETNQQLLVSAQRGSLPSGTYKGTVTLYDSANNAFPVTVIFNVPPPPTLSATCSGCSGSGASGQTIALGSVFVNTSDFTQPISFDVSTSTANTIGPKWLTASASAGNTGSSGTSITLIANLTGLALGNYSGTVTVTPTSQTANGAVPLGAAANVTSGTLQVTWTLGPKANQTGIMALTSPSATAGSINVNPTPAGTPALYYSYQIEPGANWLQVAPPPPAATTWLTTPNGLTVSASATGLTPNTTYKGVVDVSDTSGAPPTSVIVTLAVPQAPSVTADNTNLSFTPGQGNAVPASQAVNLTASDGSHLGFTAIPSNSWFSVQSSQNTTPAVLTVSIPQPLPTANASGTITVSPSPGNGTAAATINVSFKVSNGPSITSLVVSSTPSPTISQNTWVEVHGTNLASTTTTWTTLPASAFANSLPTSLAGVSATVDGKPAAIYYVSPTQVNLLTPLDTATGLVPVQLTTTVGTSSTVMATEAQDSPAFLLYDGVHIAAEHLNYSLLGPVSSSAPGYSFTPAAPNETVTFYATGFGQTSPPIGNQLTGNLPLPKPWPTVLINGLPATVVYAGLSGSGLYLLNVTVPLGAANGDNTVVASYNGFTSQAGAYLNVAVQN